MRFNRALIAKRASLLLLEVGEAKRTVSICVAWSEQSDANKMNVISTRPQLGEACWHSHFQI